MSAIHLPPDLEAWARAEVEAGRAESVEALVAQVLRAKRAADDDIRAKLDEARASLSRGEKLDGEAFIARMRRRIVDLRASAVAAE